MSDHSGHHDISKHVRLYIIVFVALLVGTVVTVGLNYLHFESLALTIGIALFVATIKGALVAGHFMHLTAEKKLIYIVLAFTVFFVIALMVLTIWAMGDVPHLPGGVPTY
jgi:cytochrome c oxidase subunit 4